MRRSSTGPRIWVAPYSQVGVPYREESIKGSIRPGMLADLVELDRNPLKVDPDEIKDIHVIRTIKHGKQIYAR